MNSDRIKRFTNFFGVILFVFSLIFGIVKGADKTAYVLLVFSFLIFIFFAIFTSPWKFQKKGQYKSIMEDFISIFKILLFLIFVCLFVIYVNGFEKSKFILGVILFLFLGINALSLVFLRKIAKKLKNQRFRLAQKKDIDSILKIYLDGSNALKKDGVDQWQDEYVPSIKDINEHFEKDLYVLEIDGEVVSTCVLVEGIDEEYENIEGKWHTQAPYISIHKVATSEKHKKKGYGRIMMNEIYEFAQEKKMNLRIDTHEDNLKMIKFIKSCGYSYCGIVFLDGGKLKRFAYDRKYKEETTNIKSNQEDELKVERPVRCG